MDAYVVKIFLKHDKQQIGDGTIFLEQEANASNWEGNTDGTNCYYVRKIRDLK